MKIEKEIVKMIEENPIALATINDNMPHVVFVSYVKVKEGSIIITNNYLVKTIENIKKNPNVSLACHDKNWNGYEINGEAEYFDYGKWLDFILSIKENKGEPCKGALVIEIKEIKKLT
ncbi:MAG: pyridoxamine 5'-phosphate oxidase family protein [Nanoarchaeota archaeon]|nr:pyridoxamine 5'-phosphate oxidase family protein [Nanoarchaeota archaeon]